MCLVNTAIDFLVLCHFHWNIILPLYVESCARVGWSVGNVVWLTPASMCTHEQVFCKRVCILWASAISVQVNHHTRGWRLGLNVKWTETSACLWVFSVCYASVRMCDFMRARVIIYEQEVSSVCPSTAVLSAPLHPHCPVLVLHGKVHQYFGWPST